MNQLTQNWRTTLFGLLGIAAAAAAIALPKYAASLNLASQLLLGGGLAIAADGTAKKQ